MFPIRMLRMQDIGSDTAEEADRLYTDSFPTAERFPLELMHGLDGSMGARFMCYTDEGRFVGITFTIETDDYLFLNFLAVEEELRGKGYGSEILGILREESGKPLFLNMEPVTDDCDNPEQRVRRRDFYLRNGFRENGLSVTPDGNTFMGMVSGEPIPL